jgi:L-lactate utilization protein LutB
MAEKWIRTSMAQNVQNKSDFAKNIVDGLSNHILTKNHSRHIDAKEAEALGLKILSLESELKDEGFQDCVLTVHHAYMHTFSQSPAYKIVENHEGKAIIFSVPQVPVPLNYLPISPQPGNPQKNQ